MSSILWDNKFFESIFPLIKQQKPGKDLYVWQFLTQLIICFFILIFFTSMTSQQNTIAAQFYTNSLSGKMVITLFVMIFVMIIDRIIYSTSVFRSKPEPLVVNGVRNVAELSTPVEDNLTISRRGTVQSIEPANNYDIYSGNEPKKPSWFDT